MEGRRQLQLVYTYPPAPTTIRGESTHLSANKDGSKITYCSANNVIIRNTDDYTQCEVYTDHIAETTTAIWAPSGHYIASGDAKGNVRVWDIHNSKHIAKRVWDNMLPGKVKDITWAGDSQKLAVVGEGNIVFGKPLNVDTGAGLGDITGHSRTLLTAAFKPERPYRLFTAGEDKTVNFYEGTPFKFKRTHNDVHNQFITCIRINPKGEVAVSTASDKKLVTYDATTGDVLSTLSDKAHEGTVSSIAFVDDETFVTSSMDKTLKLWNLTEKKATNKYNVAEKPQIGDMQVGVAVTNSNLVSLSLDGSLNVWTDFKNTKEGSLPNQRYPGHNAGLVEVVYSAKNDLIISADSNGKILLWKGKEAIVPQGKVHEKKVTGLALSADETEVYSIGLDDKLRVLDLASREFKGQADVKAPTGITASKKQNGRVYVIVPSRKVIVVLDGLKQTKEHKVAFEPTAIEISNDEKKLYIGDQEGNVHVLDPETGKELKKFAHYADARVTRLRVSRKTDDYLASADSKGDIKLWSAKEDEKLLTNEWCYHTTTVGSLTFSADNKFLVSASNDNKAYIWNVETLKKEHDLVAIHKNGAIGAVFLQDSDNIVTAGGDNLLKHFTIQA